MEHPTINQLKQFREEVYQSMKRSADALMNLVDALSGQRDARTVAELSLEPGFERKYSSVYQAIGDFEVKGEGQQAKEKRLLQIIGDTVPEPGRNGYWLFGTDGTPAPRPYARTMEDRGFVYQPNVAKGNKPVTIGHSYSVFGRSSNVPCGWRYLASTAMTYPCPRSNKPTLNALTWNTSIALANSGFC